MAVSDVSQKYDVIIRTFEILKYQNILALTVWPIVPITFLILNNHQSGGLAAKNSNSAEIAFWPFWSNVTIEADFEAGSFVEEDWNDPEQNEVPKWMEPDRPIPTGTRAGNRKRTGMRYNRYGDDFLIDKIQPDKLAEELLSAGELETEDEWQIIDDGGHYPQEDYSTPELETDLEQSEIERRENTNLRILEWMRDVKNENCEGQSIQQVDVSSKKHKKTEDPLFCWTAKDRPLDIPPDNSDATSSTGTSLNIFVRGVGVGLTHTENLMIKKLREVRETSELELDEE